MLKRTVLFLMAGCLAFAGNASVEWLGDTHDFGAFNEDTGDVTCTFRMVNLGPEPVAITAARATCGCTTPKYSRSAILPGDTAEIIVSFNPTGRPGRFEKKVVVDTSDEASARKTLLIKGTVIGSGATMQSRFPVEAPDVRLSNSSVAFGDVVIGKGKNAYFKIYNTSSQPVVPRWSRLPAYLRIVSNDSVIAPGEQATYIFTASAGTDRYGFVQDTVMLSTSRQHPPVAIDVMAMFSEDFSKLTPGQRQKAPQIRPSDTTLDFGTFSPDQAPIVRKVSVSNFGKSPLTIRRVYSVENAIDAKLGSKTVKPGKSAEVSVTLSPDLLKGDMLNGRLVIISNDPDAPVTNIRLVGIKE